MPYFELNGVSKKTGKPLKTKTIEARDEAKARVLAEESGMSVTVSLFCRSKSRQRSKSLLQKTLASLSDVVSRAKKLAT